MGLGFSEAHPAGAADPRPTLKNIPRSPCPQVALGLVALIARSMSSVDPQGDKRVIARSSPAGLAWWHSGGKHGDASWLPAKHLLLLSERLVDVCTGRCPRLIVTMPPRHGKSELISKYTPAWYLGNFPENKVMLTSYADTFAAQWGRRARDVLEVEGPELFGVRVDPETAGGQLWEIKDHEGIMVTAGVGGGLTGKGGHLIIIDDPIKNATEASSQTTRDAQHEWWKSTVRTRLQKGGAVVLVMTRWHEDDLAGRFLRDSAANDGDHWEILNLPGLAEEDDTLGREPGEPLWPEMFDKENLEATRKDQGMYWFTAMYQQRPSPAEGMLFKRDNFRYFEKMDAINEDGDALVKIHRDNGVEIFDPSYGLKFQTADVAGSSKEDSDFTVIATWIVTPNKDLLLWDLERVQFDAADLGPFFRRKFFEQRPSIVGIERLGFGLAIIQELSREGLPIIRLEPDKDKVSRALPAVARFEEHRMYTDMHAHYKGDYEKELLDFPNGVHDDMVDVTAYAALKLATLAPHAGRVRGNHNTTAASTHATRGRGSTMTGGLLTKQM